MSHLFSFKCAQCEELHEGMPNFFFSSPVYYECLDESEKADSELMDDTCVIRARGEIHFFAKVCLEIPVIGVSDSFVWGVWISLSSKSYKSYTKRKNRAASYFGWLSNEVPFYPGCLEVKTIMHPREKGMLPIIELEPTGHPLAIDHYKGMSMERAQEIAAAILHPPEGVFG